MSLRDKKANAALAARARASKLSAQFEKFTALKRRPADDRLISKQIVCYKANLTYPQIWKLMMAGKFPRSVRLGAKAAWYESEVNAWLNTLQRTAFKGD